MPFRRFIFIFVIRLLYAYFFISCFIFAAAHFFSATIVNITGPLSHDIIVTGITCWSSSASVIVY